jgi:hypothetical protein
VRKQDRMLLLTRPTWKRVRLQTRTTRSRRAYASTFRSRRTPIRRQSRGFTRDRMGLSDRRNGPGCDRAGLGECLEATRDNDDERTRHLPDCLRTASIGSVRARFLPTKGVSIPFADPPADLTSSSAVRPSRRCQSSASGAERSRLRLRQAEAARLEHVGNVLPAARGDSGDIRWCRPRGRWLSTHCSRRCSADRTRRVIRAHAALSACIALS